MRIKAGSVVRLLEKKYPDVKCSLFHSQPWQLLIATILSAQCTDARVNIVTRELWKKYHSLADFANAPVQQIEEDIRTTGFFRNKAKNIRAACALILQKYQGTLPDTLEALTALPGVGRKTANVVLGSAFGKPALVVDTHVKRICKLLGLTKLTDPVKIEFELMEILPRSKWSNWAHQLITHGRAVCVARRPKCDLCALTKYCDDYQTRKSAQ